MLTLDVNGRAFFNALVIFSCNSSGNITYQEVRGWMIRNLGKAVRDLNGDGHHELVIPTQLISYSTAETFTWPAVYRPENGKYVEASRDFPSFYDKEVLPALDKRIREAQAKTAAGSQPLYIVAVLKMERDKILRIIGRDQRRDFRKPTSG